MCFYQAPPRDWDTLAWKQLKLTEKNAQHFSLIFNHWWELERRGIPISQFKHFGENITIDHKDETMLLPTLSRQNKFPVKQGGVYL